MNKSKDTANISVQLIPLSKSHLQKTFDWISDPSLRNDFLMNREITWDDHVAYFDRVFNDPTQSIFAILYNCEHVGNCGFKELNVSKNIGELWIYLGEVNIRGKGIGTQAVQLLLQKGLELFGLSSVVLHVSEQNLVARSIYEKLGFEKVESEDLNDIWEKKGSVILEMVKRVGTSI